jgi:uroporphyrinogen-III decarboxylase
MLVPKKTALMGNIDPTGILLSRDSTMVRNEISRVTAWLNESGFIVSAGGGLNATPKENMGFSPKSRAAPWRKLNRRKSNNFWTLCCNI